MLKTTRGEVSTHDGKATIHDRPVVSHTGVAIPLPSMEPVAESLQGLTIAAPFGERYQHLDRLGIGGMGDVSLCSDHVIGRDVALKVIRSERVRDPVTTARFLREARVQGQLEHPSIVPVYDVGATPDGAAFFTMKRVAGFTLDAIVEGLASGDLATGSRFSQRRLLNAVVSICLAVDFAHRRGVLHRDLKPANIMLGDYGEVSVLDWGLAKLVGLADEPGNATTPIARVSDSDDASRSQTQAGQMLGTPGYMAPEQTRGEVDQLDERTDVYALGAILFEVLALRPLHHADTIADLIVSTLGGCDARPSVVRSGIAPQLDEICVRATARDPNERYATARDLANAIESYLDAELAIEMRRKLAAGHVAAARARSSDSSSGRLEALRELGRALALDPTHADALRTMADVIASTPRELPPDANAELEQRANEGRRHAMRALGQRYLLWLAFIPLIVLMGVRLWLPTSIVFFGSLMSGLLGLWSSRQQRVRRVHRLLLLISTTVTIAAASWLVGPLVVVPALAATNANMFCMHGDPAERRYVTVGALLAILVPFALEQLHIAPAAYRFADGAMQILPRATLLPANATLLTLLVTSLAMVALPARAIGHMRDALAAAERRVFVQAWQLKQLVPDATRAVVTGRR